MTVSKLSIANGALRLLKEAQLTQSELTNNSRESARVFNAVWDDGGVRACLEAGQWRFAKRTILLDYSQSVSPGFGFTYAFDKPTDWVRTVAMSINESLEPALKNYRDEAGFWFADSETLYLSYISDDALFGGDYSLWPQSFLLYAQAYFACEMEGPLTDKGAELLKLRKMRLEDALHKDAITDPSRSLPVGSWVRARMAGRGSNRREHG